MLKSQHYLFMESLVRRIHEDDSEASLFYEEFYRMQAGLSGEIKLKYTLADHHFEEDYCILYNFESLNEFGFSHQIDALLITQQFILIIEVKQISGHLYYKPSVHEFSRRKDNDCEENLPNPFDQAYRHQLFIEHLLQKHHIHIPTLHLVVIANYRAKLDSSLEMMPIIHLSGLPTFIKNLFANYPATSYSLVKIQQIFQQMIQPLPARRQIEASRLKTGIFCNNCDTKMHMLFHYGVWHCNQCKAKSKDALLSALHDYRILISPCISNHAFRSFTGIPSVFAASRILSQLNLQAIGDNKGRSYIIPEDILWNNMGDCK